MHLGEGITPWQFKGLWKIVPEELHRYTADRWIRAHTWVYLKKRVILKFKWNSTEEWG